MNMPYRSGWIGAPLAPASIVAVMPCAGSDIAPKARAIDTDSSSAGAAKNPSTAAREMMSGRRTLDVEECCILSLQEVLWRPNARASWYEAAGLHGNVVAGSPHKL